MSDYIGATTSKPLPTSRANLIYLMHELPRLTGVNVRKSFEEFPILDEHIDTFREQDRVA